MNSKTDVQIRSIQEMTDRMIAVSEQGFASCDDDGCLLLNGMVRECAYRLRDAAERELLAHGLTANRGGAPAARTAAETRRDASITGLVRATLAAHRSTSPMRTEIETRNGEVTVSGVAANAAGKSLITRLVADINGVTCVKNQMTVDAGRAGRTGGSPPGNASRTTASGGKGRDARS